MELLNFPISFHAAGKRIGTAGATCLFVSFAASSTAHGSPSLEHAFDSLSYSERQDLQSELRSMGYDDIIVDGEYGPITERRILSAVEKLNRVSDAKLRIETPEDAAVTLYQILEGEIVSLPSRAVEPSATIPEELQAQASEYKPLADVEAFIGDFTGDGVSDMLGVVTYFTGNAVDVSYLLFEGDGGIFEYSGTIAEAYGSAPYDVKFGEGRISYVFPSLKEDDPRCCPSGIKFLSFETTEGLVR